MEENYQQGNNNQNINNLPPDNVPSDYASPKTPWWQWILLGVLIVVVVSGLVYYFLFYNNSGYNYSQQEYENNYQVPVQNTVPQNYPTDNTNVVDQNPTNIMPPSQTPPAPTPTQTTPPAPVPPLVNNPPSPVSIQIKGYAYLPDTITIRKGTTITWTNYDSVAHTVTGSNGGPNSSYFGQNGTYSYTFNTVGNFPYYCIPHPYMKGTVQVTN